LYCPIWIYFGRPFPLKISVVYWVDLAQKKGVQNMPKPSENLGFKHWSEFEINWIRKNPLLFGPGLDTKLFEKFAN